ncbi:unnamed protein product [Penicillium salamii]|uniref:Protein kinase domain-containing protein n=1 Tax=Penicillium salamii TaxID=1612424 RepID=A0A9W4IS00_9EURO|nr:unnamed protein product [Penicillium salamii]CAG8142871.1 unnamed protein product [Penicillium salamii]CAG8305928.1 unnamed protein product [Penicillium salamii]CAG8331265.1 unnamed protein product [Penicillium salamii]CAG8355239.1 unnamed protein product [Penicillium salamii]
MDGNAPVPEVSELNTRPGIVASASYDSPQRHRRRDPRAKRPVKETLDARSEYYTSQDDGTAEHRINQYVIKQEIGRGSFGAVHLAADRAGNEYAVKEFSKSRLRKRAQSHLLRRPRGPRRPGTDFNSPLHRHPSGDDTENGKNPLYLIKEEIAIMKKLNHHNLVSLIEVLDDPSEDSLYMVMEMCKKGVIMKVGLEERADPYDNEHCRCWFRDLILGIEYLHAQGIVHRDIKPDNCLVTNDDVLKVVDFGVSEMFEKNSDMFTAKSAGSPAFLPPELCVVKHGDVSGKATDIWSMGVTLYCLRYGKLPFEKHNIFELYDSIRGDHLVCENEEDQSFKDLMERILEKDPEKRIDMFGLRDHPWVTKDGTDPLLSFEDNTSQIIAPPTEEEMESAITTTMGHLMTMKAVKKFKRLTDPTKTSAPQTPMQSILGGDESYFVEPPMEMDPDEPFPAVGEPGLGLGAGVRKAFRHPFAGFREPQPGSSHSTSFSSRQSTSSQRPDIVETRSGHASPALSRTNSAAKRSMEGTRGHARDPLEEEFPFLFIGPSTYTGSHEVRDEPAQVFAEPDALDQEQELEEEPEPMVSESPGAAEFDIYETAYRSELERIKQGLEDKNTGPKVYLNRRVENKDEVMRLAKEKALDLQIGQKFALASRRAGSALGSAVNAFRSMPKRQADQEDTEEGLDNPEPKRPSVSGAEPRPQPLEAEGVFSTGEDSKGHLREILDANK